MATYSELNGLRSDSDLTEKTQVAVVVVAQNLIKDGATPTAPELAWSNSVLRDPAEEARKALLFVLASNSSATVEVITGASDATIQAKVDEVALQLIAAMAGA